SSASIKQYLAGRKSLSRKQAHSMRRHGFPCFDCAAIGDDAGIAAQDLPDCLAVLSPELDIQVAATYAQIGQGDVWQPCRQVWIDIQLVVRGVRLDAKNRLQQREAGARGPGLRHVGTKVLHGKAGTVALD